MTAEQTVAEAKLYAKLMRNFKKALSNKMIEIIDKEKPDDRGNYRLTDKAKRLL